MFVWVALFALQFKLVAGLRWGLCWVKEDEGRHPDLGSRVESTRTWVQPTRDTGTQALSKLHGVSEKVIRPSRYNLILRCFEVTSGYENIQHQLLHGDSIRKEPGPGHSKSSSSSSPAVCTVVGG